MAQNKEQIVVNNRDVDAQAHIYHIDGRVTAIEGQLTNQTAQLSRIENSLLNKEPFFNFGNVTTLMLMVAGLLYGINGFVDLRIIQIQQDTDRNERAVENLEAFQREMHYEVGKFSKDLDDVDERDHANEEKLHEIDARLREVEQMAAAALVSRKAIGAYVEDVDKFGSRRWVNIDTGKGKGHGKGEHQ